MKKCILLLVFLILGSFTSCFHAEERVYPVYRLTEEPEAVWESLNLVANPGFERYRLVAGEPEWWEYWEHFGGDGVVVEGGAAERGLSNIAHSGKKSAHIKSVHEGFYGGWLQPLSGLYVQHFIRRHEQLDEILPNTEYKLSAWVKTKMSGGQVHYVRCDIYDESYDGYSDKNYHGHAAGTTTQSMDWTRSEVVFRTPATIRSATVHPGYLQGKGEVWVDDVRLHRRLTPSGKIVFRDSFDQPEQWKLTCHVDGRSGVSPEKTGTTFIPSDTVRFGDAQARRLNYNFATKGHDAAILSRKVEVGSAGIIKLAVHGDASRHRIFCVLTDSSGERHFLWICKEIDWEGWKVLYRSLDVLRKPPLIHAVREFHFGGDRNQKLDFPIIEIAIGLADRYDAFTGSGEIYFGLVEIMAPNE